MKYPLLLLILVIAFSCKKAEIDNFQNADLFSNNINAPITNETLEFQKDILKIEKEYVEVLDRPNGIRIHTLVMGDQIKVSGLSYPENNRSRWIEVLYHDKWEKYGWIKSECIGDFVFIPTELVFVKEIKSNDYSADLCISYEKEGNIIEGIVNAVKSNENTVYTFYWDNSYGDIYYFLTIPGIYVYEQNLGKISHVSYLGKGDWSYGAEVTNDLKYVLQDIGGNSPGTRNLYIYDLETCEKLYGFLYKGEWNLKGYSFERIMKCGFFDYRNNKYCEYENLDLELKKLANEFIENTEKPENKELDIAVMVRCEYNFVTKERNIIEFYYLVSVYKVQKNLQTAKSM